MKRHTQAAKHGTDRAHFNLGDCYEYGKGTTKNLAEAEKWYKKAAEQGNARAQFDLWLRDI